MSFGERRSCARSRSGETWHTNKSRLIHPAGDCFCVFDMKPQVGCDGEYYRQSKPSRCLHELLALPEILFANSNEEVHHDLEQTYSACRNPVSRVDCR